MVIMYKELQKRIRYTFKNVNLLEDALTHSSYANDNNVRSSAKNNRHNIKHNETMEFLGDAILDFVIAEHLFKLGRFCDEGDLSRRRAAIVCEKALAECALGLGLGDIIRLGRSIITDNGKNNPSILSDAMEALFAAVYLDGGLNAVRKVILWCLDDIIQLTIEEKSVKDYKTFLQEALHNRRITAIEYIVIKESGPDHNKLFTSQVKVEGIALGTGVGSTKKESEQNAAKQTIEMIATIKNGNNNRND